MLIITSYKNKLLLLSCLFSAVCYQSQLDAMRASQLAQVAIRSARSAKPSPQLAPSSFFKANNITIGESAIVGGVGVVGGGLAVCGGLFIGELSKQNYALVGVGSLVGSYNAGKVIHPKVGGKIGVVAWIGTASALYIYNQIEESQKKDLIKKEKNGSTSL